MAQVGEALTREKVTVRGAQESDLGSIRHIYNHYVANSTATFATSEETAQERQLWWDDHCRSGHPVVVAVLDGVVVGWASLSRYNPRCAYSQTAEPSIYVAREHLGRGLGRVLMEALVAEAARLGYHCLVVLICTENTASIELARAFGFEPVGTLKEVGRKFDRWLDVTIHQRIL